MISRLKFDGQPDWAYWDYVWYEDRLEKKCTGQPVSKYTPARCGRREAHPLHEFTGTGVVQVRKGEVVEVDLEDGSARALAMRGFLDRGVAHVMGP